MTLEATRGMVKAGTSQKPSMGYVVEVSLLSTRNEGKVENGVGHSQQGERGSEDLSSSSSETTSI